MALVAGVAATRQHLLALVVRDEAPQHDAFADLHLDIGDRPALAQAGAHQGGAVARQPAGQCRAFIDPGLQRRVECQRPGVAGQHQAGLRVLGEQGIGSVVHGRRLVVIVVLLYCYSRYS
ncbi:hypothetical protein D3C75_854300 [compost metagenome]